MCAGEKVAVKLLKGKRAAATCKSEARVLTLPTSPHLVHTHAVVQYIPTQQAARILWSIEQGGQVSVQIFIKMVTSPRVMS